MALTESEEIELQLLKKRYSSGSGMQAKGPKKQDRGAYPGYDTNLDINEDGKEDPLLKAPESSSPNHDPAPEGPEPEYDSDEHKALLKKYDFKGYEKIHNEEKAKDQKESDEALKRAQAEEDSPSLHMLNKGLKALEVLGKWYDSYSGSSTARKFVGELQEGKTLKESVKNASEYYGRPDVADQAPTGSDIAKKAGVPAQPLWDMAPNISDVEDEKLRSKGFRVENKEKSGDGSGISPADVAGFGYDAALDPLGVIPIRSTLKAGAEAAKYIGEKAFLKAPAKVADFALGTKTITKAVDNTMDTVKKVFRPNQRPDWERFQAIAKKHGIDPDYLSKSVEFPEESIVSRGSRTQAEGILGAENLAKFQEGTEQINRAIKKTIEKISGGKALAPTAAGKMIRDGIQKKFGQILDADSLTHNNIIKNYPSLKLSGTAIRGIESKLKGIEKFAKGRIARGADPKQVSEAKRLLFTIDQARKVNGSYKQYYELLDSVGEFAFVQKNKYDEIPFYQDKLQDLYFGLRNQMIDDLGFQKGNAVADKLRKTNKELAAYLKNRDILRAAGDMKVSDEKVFQRLVLNGDSNTIKALKNSISKEELNKIKSAYLENIRFGHTNEQDLVGLRSFINQLKKKGHINDGLFDPGEMDDLNELMELGFAMGERKMSSSGTSAGNVLKDIWGGVKAAIVNEAFIENLAEAARARSKDKSNDELMKLARKMIKDQGLWGTRQDIEIVKQAFLDSLRGGRKIINKETVTGTKAFMKAPQQYGIQKREYERRETEAEKRRRALKGK